MKTHRAHLLALSITLLCAGNTAWGKISPDEVKDLVAQANEGIWRLLRRLGRKEIGPGDYRLTDESDCSWKGSGAPGETTLPINPWMYLGGYQEETCKGMYTCDAIPLCSKGEAGRRELELIDAPLRVDVGSWGS